MLKMFWETTGSLLGPFDIPFWSFRPAQCGTGPGSCIPLWCPHPWTDPKHDLELSWIFRMEMTNSMPAWPPYFPLSIPFTVYSLTFMGKEEKRKETQAWLSSHPGREEGRRVSCCRYAGLTGQNPGYRGLEL